MPPERRACGCALTQAGCEWLDARNLEGAGRLWSALGLAGETLVGGCKGEYPWLEVHQQQQQQQQQQTPAPLALLTGYRPKHDEAELGKLRNGRRRCVGAACL